jgi:hypothetical protein
VRSWKERTGGPAEDEPEPFTGRPNAGRDNGEPDPLPTRGPNVPREILREVAQDARSDSYFDRFPANSHVGVSW